MYVEWKAGTLDQLTALSGQDPGQVSTTLAQHITAAIDAARVVEDPFYHIELERVFPDEVYGAMLANMPLAADCRPMSGRARGNDLPDGTHTRVKIDLFPEYIRHLPAEKRAIWGVVGNALCSAAVKHAFLEKLAPGLKLRFGPGFRKVGMYPIPTMFHDIPGYRIAPHTDTRWKAITVQLCLPRDKAHADIGTIFHERLPDGSMPMRRQMQFVPNSGYAFAVGTDTWHSVALVGPDVTTRDSILLTYFVDAGLFKVLLNRGKRAGNFVLNELRHLRSRSFIVTSRRA